jgi:apolipoprotein N-acyltransferase
MLTPAAWRLRWAVPLAIVSGALQWLAFPTPGIRVLAVPGVAALVLAARAQRPRVGFGLGALAGLVFLLPHLEWIRVVGTNAWIVLTLLEVVFFGCLGAAIALVTTVRGWPVWVPALWVAQEAVRGRVPLGGFSWGRLAFSQDDGTFTPWAAVGGAPLVSFLVALVGALLAAAVLDLSLSRQLFAGRSPLRALVIAAAAALVAIAGPVLPGPPAVEREVVAAVVQGNVPRLGLDAFSQRRKVTSNHLDATRRLAADVAAGRVSAPDLVVWPENSTDNDPRTDAQAAAALTEAATLMEQPVLVGAVLDRTDGRLENAGLVWTPEGALTEMYVKRHLVPYGEYVPLRKQLEPIFGLLALVPRDFVPGDQVGLLDVNGTLVADVICFEIAYDDLIGSGVRGGGEVIVVQSNNATYGGTAQPEQQFAITRLRAVEHGRSVLVAATSGISALIEPDGDVVRRSKEFTQTSLVATLPVTSQRTLATRVGALPETVLSLLGLVPLLLASIRAVAAFVTRRRPAAA